MNETLIKQETIRQYLLGDLPEAERARLEDRFLGDEQLFEQIEDAENDLVDDYVGERLGWLERKLFENYYLAMPENSLKVETARVLRREQQNAKVATTVVAADSTKNQIGFWQSIQNFFASGLLAPAAGFAVLLFSVGGLWFVLRPSSNNEIVYSPTPAPTIAPTQVSPTLAPETNFNAANSNQSSPQLSPIVPKNINAAPPETKRPTNSENKVQPTPRQIPPAVQSTVTLALITGLVRGEVAANKLVLPKNANQVRLTFVLPAKKYVEIQARIETVSGGRIWSGKIKQTGGRVALNLPAKLFADEDYLLIVSGIGEAGGRTDFSQFYFNSARK